MVLNGCTDNTLGVVQRVAAEFPGGPGAGIQEPIGKGGALIEGLKLASLGDLIGYVDADGATPPHAFLELVKKIGEADCVIGSRWFPVRSFTNRRRATGNSPAECSMPSCNCCSG